MDVIAKMDIEKVDYNIRRGSISVYVNDEEVRCSFRLGRPTNNNHHPKLMSSSSSVASTCVMNLGISAGFFIIYDATTVHWMGVCGL